VQLLDEILLEEQEVEEIFSAVMEDTQSVLFSKAMIRKKRQRRMKFSKRYKLNFYGS